MNQQILDAIRNKKVLVFTYQGHHRIVEPHAYGLSLKQNEVIRCYQTGGTSDSGTVPCWRLMEINEIQSLCVTEEHFLGARNEYKKGDKSMSKIFCEL